MKIDEALYSSRPCSSMHRFDDHRFSEPRPMNSPVALSKEVPGLFSFHEFAVAERVGVLGSKGLHQQMLLALSPALPSIRVIGAMTSYLLALA
ncbi:hypothetical protein NPIL_374951 [Nephila pilipes]|uniref:Uncharacterized protein n=1 Tax=Nephila pilipes TaxID=299642 RepID=A0A8X6N424_NEPPI|nr:hypothetical protein NPIL_374951 [Nephila pilipes]